MLRGNCARGIHASRRYYTGVCWRRRFAVGRRRDLIATMENYDDDERDATAPRQPEGHCGESC